MLNAYKVDNISKMAAYPRRLIRCKCGHKRALAAPIIHGEAVSVAFVRRCWDVIIRLPSKVFSKKFQKCSKANL
jgi:hypothetical protein